MSVDYSVLGQGYDEAPENDEKISRPLPRGVYPFRITKVIGTDVTKNGIPRAAIRVEVTEGPFEGDGFIHNFYLGAGKNQRINNGDGTFNEVERTPEEFQKAVNGVQGRLKRFLNAIGLEKQVPVSAPTSPEFVFEMFNFSDAAMVGREFIDEVTLWNGNPQLKGAQYSFDNRDNGIEAWRREFLPKQERARGGSNGAAAGTVGTL